MKRSILVALVLCLAAASTAVAQINAATSAIESPYKNFEATPHLGTAVKCSLSRAPLSLFGVTQVTSQSTPTFLVSELISPYSVAVVNESCSLLTTWSTGISGPTMTGIAYDPVTQNTYWAVNFIPARIEEFTLGTGTPTGRTVSLGPGIWGPLCVNQNVPGEIAYVENISTDVIFQVNLATSAIGCTFANPGNMGSGAFGNGIDDAADNASGADIVVTYGTIDQGQVTSASQTDCDGPLVPDTWNLFAGLNPVGETFPNGIAEFVSPGDGSIDLAVAGNVTATFYILEQAIGITDCQSKDGENVLSVNNRTGASSGWQLSFPAISYLRYKIVLPSGGGNGKFLAHINAGAPSAATVTNLPAQLGPFCFPVLIPPFGTASPACVWNNIGKTERVGASNYFGTSIPNPNRAPTTFLTLPTGDPTNMPAGTTWTVQGIILNPTGSSPKLASVTNGIQVNLN